MLLNILLTIILPIFVLMAVGYLLDRAFNLDVQTLSRLSFYAFTPALIFTTAYRSTLTGPEISRIAAFAAAQHVLLGLLALLAFSLRPLRTHRPVMALGAVFYNAGIYGIPLMLLAFGEDAVSIIGVVLTVHALLFFTLGVWLFVGADRGSLRATLGQFLRYPVLYGLVLGFALRSLDLSLPVPLQTSVDYLMQAFVGISLLTLGVQLSKSPAAGDGGPVAAVSLMRFAASPLLAVALIPLFGLEPRIAAPLTVASALPVAVNVYILAAEVGQDAPLASRLVFWTTALSAGAIPVVLLALGRN